MALAAPALSGPRVRVAALILVDDKIVVVRHKKGDSEYYLLPGGGVNYRETIEAALIREVAEETGLACSIGRPLIINDTIEPDGTRHAVNITFEANVVGGSITEMSQDPLVVAVELIEPKNLENLDFRPPIARDLVRAVLEGDDFKTLYAGSLFVPER
ncbi:MAG: NUDIX domain-containing protein [Coriobacteriia bacterium]